MVSANALDQSQNKRLEHFFETLLQNSAIGYSLLGEKPVSVEFVPSLTHCPVLLAPDILFKCYGYPVLKQGVFLWTNQSQSIKNTNFHFFYSEKYQALIFINQAAALKVISKNLDLFRKYLPGRKLAEDILEALCKKEEFFSILYSHPILTGILFGFGRNNSIAFANGGYIQLLQPSIKFTGEEHLYAFPQVGFLMIANGTNRLENDNILKDHAKTRTLLQQRFKKGEYLQEFMNILNGK